MSFDVGQLTSMIGNLGFPIVVAGYCLYTLNNTMKTLNNSVQENTRVLTLLCNKMNIEAPKCEDDKNA